MITVEQLTVLGADFLANGSDGQINAVDLFEMENRCSTVILSAPHATNTFVNGKRKKIDLFTGEIVSALGDNLAVSTIVRTKFAAEEVKISDFVIERIWAGISVWIFTECLRAGNSVWRLGPDILPQTIMPGNWS